MYSSWLTINGYSYWHFNVVPIRISGSKSNYDLDDRFYKHILLDFLSRLKVLTYKKSNSRHVYEIIVKERGQ